MDDLTLDQPPAQREDSRRQSDESPPELPNYRLEQRIGQGTFGTVWAGVQLRTQLQVAIKVLQRPALGWEGFVREVDTLRRVAEHPAVVTLLDADLEHQPPYFVMPWLRHGSLAECPRPNLKQLVEWFRQAAEALSFTHAKGVLHCDLKPSNLLLDEENRIRLVDFGQSLMRDAAGQSLGTLGTMPPEQTLPHSIPDARWDVYSLGATFYWLLMGEPPRLPTALRASLGSGTLAERTQRYRDLLQQQPLRRLGGVDSELAAILNGCLQLNPALRVPSMDQILEDLRNRELGQPLLCRRPWSFTYRLSKWVRRPTVAITVLAGMAMAGGGVFWSRDLASKNQELSAINERLGTQEVGLRWEAGVQAELQERPELAMLHWSSLLAAHPQDPCLRLLIGTGHLYPLLWRMNLGVNSSKALYNSTGRICFSRDGSQLALILPSDVGQSHIEARDAGSGRLLWKEEGAYGALVPGPGNRWLLTFQDRVQIRHGPEVFALTANSAVGRWTGDSLEFLLPGHQFYHWNAKNGQLLKGGRITSGPPLLVAQGNQLWDLAQHREFSPGPQWQAVECSGSLAVWVREDRVRVVEWPQHLLTDQPCQPANLWRLSPDGRRLVFCTRTALVCLEIPTGRALWRRAYQAPPLVVEFDPQSENLVVGETGSARVLDRHGETLAGPWPTRLNTSAACFSPDGHQLALLSSQGDLELRKVNPTLQWVTDQPSTGVAWHPEGWLTQARAMDVEAPGWKTRVGTGYPPEMRLQVGLLHWTGDGRNLEVGLSTSQTLNTPWDRIVGRYWLNQQGLQTFPVNPNGQGALPPSWASPDGRWAVSYGQTPLDTGHGIAPPAHPKRTDLPQLVALRSGLEVPLLGQNLPSGRCYWSDDCRYFAVASQEGLSLWCIDSKEPLWDSPWDDQNVPWVALANEGRWVAAARDRQIHAYRKDGLRRDLDPGPVGVASLWFSHHGDYLVVGTQDRRLLATHLPEERWIQVGGSDIQALAFHPGHPWVAVSNSEGVRLYDLETGRPVSVRAPGLLQAFSLAFDGRGERLAIAGPAGVAVWKLTPASGPARSLASQLDHDLGAQLDEQGQLFHRPTVAPTE